MWLKQNEVPQDKTPSPAVLYYLIFSSFHQCWSATGWCLIIATPSFWVQAIVLTMPFPYLGFQMSTPPGASNIIFLFFCISKLCLFYLHKHDRTNKKIQNAATVCIWILHWDHAAFCVAFQFQSNCFRNDHMPSPTQLFYVFLFFFLLL